MVPKSSLWLGFYHETYMDSESTHDPHYMEQSHHPRLQSRCKRTQPLDPDMLCLKVEDTLDLSNHQSQPQLKHQLFIYERHDVCDILHSLMCYLSHIL